VITELLLATHNRGKVREIVPLLEGVVEQVICLRDLDTRMVVNETEKTFEGNAMLKSEAIFKMTGTLTLADDSGIEVDSLDGRPGVYSARFAGKKATDEANNTKLLQLMEDVPDERRTARFRCVMALTGPDGTHTFEGKVEGKIARKPAGDCGFGYDPLFIPDGYTKTFAELGLDIKTSLSHRTRALEQVVAFLKDR